MIKWSDVETPQHAAESIANFIFPILSQYDFVALDNDSEFARSFFTAFSQRAAENKGKAKVIEFTESQSQSPGHFDLRIIKLDKSNLQTLCTRGEKIGCVGLKALKKFEKKPRDRSKIWINMFRLNETNAVLYFN